MSVTLTVPPPVAEVNSDPPPWGETPETVLGFADGYLRWMEQMRAVLAVQGDLFDDPTNPAAVLRDFSDGAGGGYGCDPARWDEAMRDRVEPADDLVRFAAWLKLRGEDGKQFLREVVAWQQSVGGYWREQRQKSALKLARVVLRTW